MKKKILGIFVCMLLIGTANVALADWEPGDGHKMHYPQLPDPYGFDVDFGYWALGDDWQCSGTGTVDDIHFWISWFYDDPIPIPEIIVEIWSNNPIGPHGWSAPLDLLWERSFVPGQFIEAGPWPGEQLWMMPYGEIIPQPHFFYWQINIPDIENPFIQEEGEIYWLVIRIPWFGEYMVGWKTTTPDLHFMDFAVWWNDIEEDWWEIPGIDFAFVITGEIFPKIPELDCDGDLTWTGVKPGGTVTDSFNVSNIGDPNSELDWDITEWPEWGSWDFDPDGGTALKPEDGPVSVQVTVVAPQGVPRGILQPRDNTYTGEVKVVNLDDPSDFCTIHVSLTTPKNKAFNINLLFLRFLENHPHMFPVIRHMLGL